MIDERAHNKLWALYLNSGEHVSTFHIKPDERKFAEQFPGSYIIEYVQAYELESVLREGRDNSLALSKLSHALGNPCLSFNDDESLPEVLVDFALARLHPTATVAPTHGKSPEEQAREILDRIIDRDERWTAGEVVEIANLIADRERFKRDAADAREQLAAAQSREVCTVAHDNVETCGYCQRDAMLNATHDSIDLIRATEKLQQILDGTDEPAHAALMRQYGWTWRDRSEFGLRELYDNTGRILGWINNRPSYCDRGHWQVGIELSGIDAQDAFPRYFMRRETAEQEMVEFLAWRIHKRRAEVAAGPDMGTLIDALSQRDEVALLKIISVWQRDEGSIAGMWQADFENEHALAPTFGDAVFELGKRLLKKEMMSERKS